MSRQVYFVLQFSHDVTCIVDQGSEINCKMEARNISARREALELPLYLPYIPQTKTAVFNCLNPYFCTRTELSSLREVTDPKNKLNYCLGTGENLKCGNSKFFYYKNIDKLLFLENHIKDKLFYTADCLLYDDNERVCLKKDAVDIYAKLMQTGDTLKPNIKSILMQEELICEENKDLHIYCDVNKYVPYPVGLKTTETADIFGRVVLKTNTNIEYLHYTCIESWCGYTNQKPITRRFIKNYEFDAGKTYKCYSAKGQKICKEITDYDPYLHDAPQPTNEIEIIY